MVGWRRVLGRDVDIEGDGDVVATDRAGQIDVATQRDLVVEVAHLRALPLLKHLLMLAVAALSIVLYSLPSIPSYDSRCQDSRWRSRLGGCFRQVSSVDRSTIE